MVEGRSRWQRGMLAAQAMLVWTDDSFDVTSFIKTGLAGKQVTAVFKADPAMREAIVKAYEGGS